MKQYSSLTFNNIAEFLPFIEVVWNGKVVYRDGSTKELDEFYYEYGDRIVYEISMRVVDVHHLIIYVTGE